MLIMHRYDGPMDLRRPISPLMFSSNLSLHFFVHNQVILCRMGRREAVTTVPRFLEIERGASSAGPGIHIMS